MTDERYEAGMRVRREVLGDAHVDRATAAAGPGADFQRWITETAWGGLWTRDAQLDRRTRSCITVALLTALRAEGELRLHLRAARRNGVTVDELAEVVMHTAGYVGIPAANSAMAVLQQLTAEESENEADETSKGRR
jgi:4-carboxymuconolactone decarboxylase